jgi:hypothetical protein
MYVKTFTHDCVTGQATTLGSFRRGMLVEEPASSAGNTEGKRLSNVEEREERTI